MTPDKNILKSKTFWVNFLGGVSSLFPAVQGFIANNPTEVAAGWTVINLFLRVATKGKVTFTP